MNLRSILCKRPALLLALLIGTSTAFAGLEGQNKGDTNNWSSVNLQGWVELDYIPFRVSFNNNSAGLHTVTIDFLHLNGTTPGFEDLTSFTCFTPNVVFTSPPTLTTDPSGTWRYTFTVNILDSNAAQVRFYARLAAGAHLNPGSSLHLNSSAGNVQIHKPGVGPGAPDLAILKTGSATVYAGSFVYYSLNYTNSAATNTAVGAQVSDILPPGLTVDLASLTPNAHAVANTIFWDLTNVAPHAFGTVTFRALSDPGLQMDSYLTNFSQILSSENDFNMADNKSTWATRVICGCTNPTIVTGPISSTNCVGQSTTFSVTAGGTLPAYQWRKEGVSLAGATDSTYTILSISLADVGAYDCVVTNDCGATNSGSAVLMVNTNVDTAPLTSQTTCPGQAIAFSTVASGTGPFGFVWKKDGTVIPGASTSALNLSNVGTGDSGVYGVEVSGVCGMATQSASLIVNQPVIVTDGPISATNCAGTSASFGVSATGAGLTYQWAKNGTAIAGETRSSLSLNNVGLSDAGSYSILVSGTCGASVQKAATLDVRQNLSILSGPGNATNCVGGDATFELVASGSGLTCQWYKGQVPLGGKTGTSLNLTNVTVSDAGVYSVIIQGVCDSPVTNSAALVVNEFPIITRAPTDATNCPGGSTTLSVEASGTSLIYQWYKGTNALAGQTSSVLSLDSLSDTDGGVYSVVVAGACGNPTTNSASLTVNKPVLVSTTPANFTNCPGTDAAFSVAATGAGLAYQWFKDAVLLPGQSGDTLSLTSVTAADAGVYTVVVSGSCGTSVTNSASLTVNQNVVVATSPASQTNCPGAGVTFNVDAFGTALTYQWFKGSAAIPGQIGNSLSIGSISAVDAGVYMVVVSGACGNSVTNSANLTVNQNVLVAGGPVSLTNCPGSSANFSVAATGTGLNFQWFKDGNAIPGQTSSSLSFPSVSDVDAGVYSVAVGGICGNSVTNSASLTVNQNVVLASTLTSQTNCLGSSTSFGVSATGTGLSYQWFKGPNLLAGETGNSLVLNNLRMSDAGIYTVVVSGTCGSPATNSATLAVNRNVAVSTAPISLTNCPGTTANFSVNAVGVGLSYQWFKDGISQNDQNTSSLQLNNVSAADAGTYVVVVSGVCGEPVTNSATLTITENVVVATAPASITNCPGSTAVFAINATGTGLAYQWYKLDALLTGETNSSLTLTNVGTPDAANYTIVVSGACGAPVTNSASLALNENVSIALAPFSITNCPGGTANFSISATGTGLTYQWFKGGLLLVGETNSNLVLTSINASHADVYGIVVSGTCGDPITNTASLTVNQNTVIASAPDNLTNCPGTSASFNIAATGTGLTYQWFKNSTPLAGQTTSSLALAAVNLADAGNYSVVVSGACGASVTNAASLIVNENVVVASAPVSLTNCPGNTATFSVTATGTGLAFQWFKGGSLLPGQTTSSLSLNNVSASDAGLYNVAVSGSCGNTLTNSASLSINQNVVLATAPSSLTNCLGSTASFGVTATGTSLTYQWFKGASLLNGQTASTLALNNIKIADGGIYSVVVSGACGNSVTNSANLTVNRNVIISSTPSSLTNCPGSSASFSIAATGSGLSYQWFKNGNTLSGQTANTLLLPSVSDTDAGIYSIIVTGACGDPVTNSASLTVNQNVVVATAPSSLTNCPGTPASFTVNATGTGLTFQWFKGGTALAGQTGSSLVLNNVSATDAGSYTVVVGGTCGNTLTNSASLSINQNVVLATAPSSLTNCLGSTASFGVTATGTSLTYQWFKGASLLNGQTASTLALNNIKIADGGIYSVVVSGACGNSVTNSANLTVNRNVIISSTPSSLTNCPGSSASFSIAATGSGLSYQWFKNGNVLSGQTANTLLLPSVNDSDAGIYSIAVTGACGDPVTNNASLTVNQNVVVATAPSSLTNCPGTPASFTVNATGTGLTFQWFKGGTALAGQTTSSLLLTNVSKADEGIYSVFISGVCGNSVTNFASLNVYENVVVSTGPGNQTNCLGTTASFNVVGHGAGLQYQWFKGSSLLIGETNATLALTNVGLTAAGDYSVVASGSCGEPVTNAASLTINQPVIVSSAPVSLTNCPGNTATFSVTATGTGLAFQWFKGGSLLPGQTTSSLSLNNVSASDAGLYNVAVSGSCGNTLTNSANLSINQNVVLATAPSSLTNCLGSTASFSVTATGTSLTYQWFKGASLLNGQTASTLALNNIKIADGGIYSVVVSGACGNSVTNSANLTVNRNVIISSTPSSLTNCPGSSASFSIAATGSGLSYQWFKNGNTLSGQTANTLLLPSVSDTDAGIYSIIVTGACGDPVTNSASLTVNQNVVVATAPSSLTNCPGTPASFTVNATGTGLTFQWFKGGTALAGQTGSSLVLNNVSATDAGSYTVVVGGTCGNTLTNSASLSVNQNVVVSSAPANLTNCPGTTASFNVNANGTGLSYQWFKDGLLLPGQMANSLVLNNISRYDAATYSVVISGTCGNSVTNFVTLTVNRDVVVSSAPSNLTNCPGSTATFSVSAVGTGLTYQWFKGPALLPGQTTSTLTLNSVAIADVDTYSVVVGGVCGNSVTNIANLAVLQDVIIASAPANLTNCAGSSANFSVNAIGAGLTYQWFKGFIPLSSQNSPNLVLTNISQADAALYTVVVNGACGTPVTNSASLSLYQNVVVATAPANQTNCPGSTASFSVSATGKGLTYQWFKGGVTLSGETTSSLILANVGAASADNYSVVVSGTCGNSITNSATLTINQNVVIATAPLSITNCPGTPASFDVAAIGTGLSYQWFKGGALLPGQTTSGLFLNNVSSSDVGIYSVVVSGVCGNSVTNSASLSVNQNLLVSIPPANLTNCIGSSVNFEVQATGTGLTYQWYKATTLLPAKTDSILSFPMLKTGNSGSYSVVVRGACGSAITNTAFLKVNQNLIVASSPVNQTNCVGGTANFEIVATGSDIAFQWFKDGATLPGQTAANLVINNVSAADAGTYSIEVNGPCGSPITNSASLTVNQQVVVSSGPASLTNCPGNTAAFTITASGTGLSYQWYKGSTVIAGQVSSTLILNNVAASDAGTYSIVVSGVCGNSVTNSASLAVNQSVVVTTSLANVTNCVGSSASLSVQANGSGLSYQWFKGVTLLPGKTDSTLNFPVLKTGYSGPYSVVVSGACGAAVTNSAFLKVNQDLVVASAPINQTNCPGSTANFQIVATGSDLNYQWFKGGAILAGQTSSTLALNNVSTADAGIYSVTVNGACGNTVTNSATLIVNQNVVISTAPASLTNCPSTVANFSVTAIGTDLLYQWFRGGSILTGQTAKSLILNNVSSTDAAEYSVVVSGSCGTSVTNSATLTVNQALVVTTPVRSLTNCIGTGASLEVQAAGTGLSYQWFKGSMLLPGKTDSIITFPALKTGNSGSYSVVVHGACGTSITNTAVLGVYQSVVVTSPLVDSTNCPGSSTVLNITATGSGLTYQWFKNGYLLPGQSANSLSLNNLSLADAGLYFVVASGTCGNSVTNFATVSVNQNVVVSSAPVSLTNCPGGAATFSMTATGPGLSYQWFRGGSILPGQTANSLLLNNISAADAGTYTIVASGACGNSITNSATLTVNQPVLVSTSPASLTNCPGGIASFSVTASGTGLKFQWFKGGSILAGQTANVFLLNNVSGADAGTYTVVASGSCGTSLTNSATLTVNQPVLVSTSPVSLTNCPGGNATFIITATGTGLSYQWLKGITILPGQTASSLFLNNISATDAGTYTVIASGSCGTSVTNAATLTVNQPVLVSTSPASLTNCPGGSATFSITAAGTGLSYQWSKGSTILPGQTASSLLLNNISVTDAGTYTVVASGSCGTSLTNSATLTVNQPVLVSTSPVSLTNCPGGNATFIITATGTGLSYQWFKGSTILPGQTVNSLLLNNISATDSGTYMVVASGSCGTSLTNFATLTVNQPVLVSTSPVSLTNCPGGTATFSVTATGAGLSYQWFKGSTILPGQTVNSLLLNNISATDSGTYTVVASGSCGTSLTNSATLTVNQPVLVSTSPVSLTNCPGGAATFSVTATGTGLSYQWFKGSTILPGQTASSLLLNNISVTDAGTYTVVASGSCGTSLTNFATLTVNQPVLVSTSPVSLTNCPGGAATFSVTATGTGLSYQWFKGSTILPGQTASSLFLNNISATDSGTYMVVASGSCGTSLTNFATLTVNQPVLVSTSPVSLTNCPGGAATFSVTATGAGLSYQWFKGSTTLPGQTASSLLFTNLSASDAGTYTIVASGTCGNSITNSATLSVNQPAFVAGAPVSMTNCPGDTAAFSVTATGTGLTYQWFKGATPLPGQTNANLILSNINSSDAANYRIVVSSACGNTITNSASLDLNAPVTASPLANVIRCPGDTAAFSTIPGGTGPFTFVWTRNGAILAGQAGSTLVLNSVSATDAGTYAVQITGACGKATNSASLTLNATTAATAMSGIKKNPGSTVTFSTVATGAAPFSYVWKKNGSVLAGKTGNSLTLNNITSSDAGNYTVEVTGGCGVATQSAALAVNIPPTVTIISPTNGTVYIAPANFTLVADAHDVDGTIAKIEFFQAGSKLGETAGNTWPMANLASGSYTFTARATDDMGATGDSAPVSVSVLAHLPLTVKSSTRFNPRTGLYEETIRVSNPTLSTYNAVRVWTYNLTAAQHLWNGTGVSNSVQYVQSNTAVLPGSYVDFLLQYYVTDSSVPAPSLIADLVPPGFAGVASVNGPEQQHINSCRMLPDNTFLIVFESIANRAYRVQYSSDLKTWQNAEPEIIGNGGTMQWIDNGEPKTQSAPSSETSRFYRLMLQP